jgi:hypothetical protein
MFQEMLLQFVPLCFWSYSIWLTTWYEDPVNFEVYVIKYSLLSYYSGKFVELSRINILIIEYVFL